jgi:hypothetical protein
MTLSAIQQGMFACQREGTGIMIKRDIFPAGRYVADRTILSKLAIMVIVLCVAGKTIFGSAFKNILRMAGSAVQLYMVANERECRGVVIEFCTCPFRGLMTCSAISAELTFVDILCGVTGEAIFRRIFVYPIHMAGLTLHIHV